jgi:hypothetical protein
VHVVVSKPCASIFRALFAPYLANDVLLCEMFARNLLRDTVSFGNQCLHRQQLENFAVIDEWELARARAAKYILSKMSGISADAPAFVPGMGLLTANAPEFTPYAPPVTQQLPMYMNPYPPQMYQPQDTGYVDYSGGMTYG